MHQGPRMLSLMLWANKSGATARRRINDPGISNQSAPTPKHHNKGQRARHQGFGDLI
ncbi:hypothetical protein DsansV1_C03g0026641 [Dioscorea sansibarensis]